MIKFLLNLIMFLLMIAIGGVAFINMKGKVKEVEHQAVGMKATLVEVIRVQRKPFSSRVIAYGHVEPTVVFQGKAEVGGKVTYVHPDLKRGGSLAAGTVVVRINPIDYKLTLDKNRSDLTASKSQLEQVMQERATTRSSVNLAKANLSLGLKELQRVRTLWHRRLIARSTFDAESQKVLQLRQTVSDAQGKLNTYASRIKSAKAKIRRDLQQIRGGKTILGRTQVVLPFDARISVANLDKGEIVTEGSVLFEAINTDAVEINAELPIRQMQILLSTRHGSSRSANPASLLRHLNLTAQVRLVGGNDQALWTGKVARFSESVDPTRRTTSVVVVVKHPNKMTTLGGTPPLLKGMYVAITLATPLVSRVVIPRKAIHSGRAFVVSATKTLEIRPLDIQSRQGNVALIRSGLKAGDQLIVNDLIPIIEGMPLIPQTSAK